jgi:hypothetical protein
VLHDPEKYIKEGTTVLSVLHRDSYLTQVHYPCAHSTSSTANNVGNTITLGSAGHEGKLPYRVFAYPVSSSEEKGASGRSVMQYLL